MLVPQFLESWLALPCEKGIIKKLPPGSAEPSLDGGEEGTQKEK